MHGNFISNMKIPQSLIRLAKRIHNKGGTLYICGGWVRDKILGAESKDFDCEIYGLEIDTLIELLSYYYKVDTVGESYKIWKVTLSNDDSSKFVADISLPRTERKVGNSHKAFEVTGDPFLSKELACKRRDFSLNSMLYAPLTDEIVDIYGGQEDIKNKVIRVVDPETFIEDSLRVLRAVQFAARFNFTVHPDTVKLCRSIDLSDLPAERLRDEIEKWLLSKHPSVGLRYFYELGIAKQLCGMGEAQDFIAKAVGKALDVSAKINSPKKADKLIIQLCLLRDVFSSTLKYKEFLEKLKLFTIDGVDVKKTVLSFCEISSMPITDSDIRRLSLKMPLHLYCFVHLCASKALGETGSWVTDIWNRGKNLGCLFSEIKPLLMGQHLIDLGLPQGKRIGEICKAVFELQLDGKINTVEEAIEKAKELI